MGVVTFLTFLFLGAILPSGDAVASFEDDLEQKIIEKTNEERNNNGLPTLKENEELNQAAFLKAQDMLGNDYFAHTSPAGVEPWFWFAKADYEYRYAGENLAMDFSSASSVHNAWMKSPTHKENILSTDYEEIGVAVLTGVIDGKETRIAVQFFGMSIESEERMLTENRIIKIANLGIRIEEASVQPWEGSVEDELLVYAKVTGNPIEVTAKIGEKKVGLQKLQEEKYMRLVLLDELEIENGDAEIVIGAQVDEEREVAYVVPKDQYDGFFEKKKSSALMTTIVSEDSRKITKEGDPRVTWQKIVLVGTTLVCIILIVNVWILEREEERLVNICRYPEGFPVA